MWLQQFKKRDKNKTSPAMARLNNVWESTFICPATVKLHKSFAASILLNLCESWTLKAETERRIPACECKCFRKILDIGHGKQKAVASVREPQFSCLCQTQGKLVRGPSTTTFQLIYVESLPGHLTRHGSLLKVILTGTAAGGRRRGMQRESWYYIIKVWT